MSRLEDLTPGAILGEVLADVAVRAVRYERHGSSGLTPRYTNPARATTLRRVGDPGETARDLAYRLYSVCERRRAKEALASNGLMVARPEIARLAAEPGVLPTAEQETF